MGQIREEKLAQCLREVLEWIADGYPDFARDDKWEITLTRALEALNGAVEPGPVPVISAGDHPLVPDRRSKMSETVDRVARALFLNAHPERSGEFAMRWDYSGEARAIWVGMAQAAIAAMREPTDPMLIAARDWSYAKYGKPIGNDAAIGCWQAMLDAALK